MLKNYIQSEFKKMPWMISIIILIGPVISLWIGFSIPGNITAGFSEWEWVFSMTLHKYSTFFFPIVTGIFAALLCRYEHLGGGWKQLFTFPMHAFIFLLANLLC